MTIRGGARLLPAALALLLAPHGLSAQQAAQVIDRIVAVVGSRAILLSEVDEDINQRRAQGFPVPQDSAGYDRLRREVLRDLIDEEVLYARASRDTSIQVTDPEVQQGVDEQYRRIRSQFRNDADLRAALRQSGFATVEEWRRWFGDIQRRALFRQRYVSRLRQEGKLRPGPVPEAELRRAYDEAAQRRGIPRRPPTITFRQIVVAPRPSARARAAAQVRAESLRVEIERGADFATVARRFSDDPGSREQGGDLGWFRREAMVREFAEVAFALRPGVVSPVVRTTYGYHLIMVDRIQPAEVKARHILVAPEISEAELAAANRLADSLAALVRGGAGMDSLARIHGDSAEPRVIGPVDRTQLDSTFARVFANAEVGQIAGPFTVSPEGNVHRTRVIVAQVTDLQPERDYSFEDAREELRQQLQQQRAIQSLVESLRRQTYIDVRL